MNKYWVLVSLAIVGIYIFFPTSYAETQVPPIIVSVQTDPYYFSEGGFGLGILKYYTQPLTPYLTSQTTSDSSTLQILNSYNMANENTKLQPIVDEKNRARYYVVHFSSTANGSQTYATFSKFQPTLSSNPLTPAGIQQYSSGFSLESLASKDKNWFYGTIINNFIRAGAPHPFNADIDIITGDGNILQTFQYTNCIVTGYVPFLSENLLRIQFSGQFKSEIRDRTDFNCVGLRVNFDLRNPSTDWSSIKGMVGGAPNQNDLAQKYVVTISSSLFKSGQRFQTFPKFTPMGVQDNIPLSIPTNPIAGKSKSFSLESLPSKDKQLFYQYVIQELSPKGIHELVDISVDMVTGDSTILQNWKYSQCDVTNYSTYRLEINPIFKFKQSNVAEIRDKTFFSCNGLQVSFLPKNSAQNFTASQTIPGDNDRAQVFTIHFSGGVLINGFDYTFPKFVPYSKVDSIFNLPDYSFGDTPRFYVESLPSKDKGNLYNLVRNYVNAGTAPQPFDASVDLTSGDGSTILSWKYSKCDITKYQPYFQSYLIVNTITEKFQPEIHEKIFFQCAGLALSGSKQSTNSKSSVQPINFVPNDSDRALYNVVKFSGGEVPTMRPFYTFAAFNPDMSASDIRTASFPQIKSKSFTLESLPSKDKADYYKFLSRYVNPTSKPEPFDATIELVAGDGTVLQTWQYQKCQATDYKTYLQSSLLFYTFSGNKASSETQDQTTFQCSGFTIQFGGTNKDLSSQQITPTSDDRVMAYVAHITSAEFTGTMSTGLVQDFDTLGNRKIQLESLASKYSSNEPFYLLSKYINPGVAPELFGVTSDLVTGDGTKLFSIKYGKCSALDYSTSLEYNIVNIKYATPIKPEIRTNGILQCSGVGADILPPVKPTDLIGPIVQKAIGISSDKIACNEGFEPMVRPPNNNVICAKNTSVSTLTQRGWEVATTSHHNLSNDIKPIIPTLDQRAVSYMVKFQGADISTQTLDTFSNFEPTSTNSYTNPSGSFSGTASFNLQSLPSKDKKDLYKLISKYINPGTKPEPFDVTVYVIGGDGTTLQTWSYGKCQVSNYNPYLDENLLLYKFHLNWQSEIKEETSFSCSGLGVKS